MRTGGILLMVAIAGLTGAYPSYSRRDGANAAIPRLYGLAGQGGLGDTLDIPLLEQQYDAGVRGRLLQLGWDVLQPSGTASWHNGNTAAFQARINAFANTGADTKIILDLGMQYTPAWVGAQDKLVDQHGNIHTASFPNGGANVYFSPTVRQWATNYIKAVFSRLNFQGRLWAVRVGPYRGELTYPELRHEDDSVSFWAYDDLAQASCPAPGWRPGEESLNGEARAFYLWYVDTLADTANYLASAVQAYAPGGSSVPVAPVMPGLGIITERAVYLMQSGVDLYAPEMDYYGTGNYWERIIPQLQGLNGGPILLWSSSVGDGTGSDDESEDRTEWSTAHLFDSYAETYDLDLFAENPGQNEYDVGTRDTMVWVMDAVSQYHYAGLMWIRESEMSTGYATLANYATEIAAHP